MSRAAREAALQVLYLGEIGRTSPALALDAYFEEHQPEAPGELRARTNAIVGGTSLAAPELDRLIGEHATNWRIERLAVLDRLILRMAIWELQETPPRPAAMVINEAIELARRFSTEESAKFVNGVLDAGRKTLQGKS
jgi:transcription antitermination protein NusB